MNFLHYKLPRVVNIPDKEKKNELTKDETSYAGTTVLVKDQKFCCQEGQTIVMLK